MRHLFSGESKMIDGKFPVVPPKMVKRATRAALADLGYPNILTLDDPYRRIITIQLSSADFLGMVGAVIAAMREPTREMVAAAGRYDHAEDAEIWQVMIDAALAE